MGAPGGSSSDDAAWRPPASGGPAGAGPPEELDGFTDLVEVGRGGDSVVYRAVQSSLNRDVAIKVLRVDDEARVVRFRREIEITVDLGRAHPNIVTVLATGITASGRPAIVMDYFEGGTLHDRLKQHGPLPPEEVARIGAVLADALSFAHERGVLHRDVKPQNVLVLPTSWVLADFGIARLADSEHTTSVETFTYRHAAPQILDGQPPTAAGRRRAARGATDRTAGSRPSPVSPSAGPLPAASPAAWADPTTQRPAGEGGDSPR